jgi:basic amino acid/polyamine antiporter, APA family
LKRPFKTPGIGFFAPAGALVSFSLMLGLPLDTWIRLAIWLIIGLAIYASYGARRSKVVM